MRKLFMLFMLGVLLAFPFSASAQGNAALSFVTVQLWPEYDDPRMLVIVDFATSAETALPATLTFRIPAEAELIAVASDAGNGQFMNVPYEQPVLEGESQTFTMVVESIVSYRFEYYQPLSFDGESRIFSYLWDTNYAVENFKYLFLEPLDVTSLSLNPTFASQQVSNGLTYYDGTPVSLATGEQYALTLNYTKTTSTLVSQAQTVQIAEPVNEDTPGRVSLANSLPYIIGGLGIIMIAGGLAYYFQWGRRSAGSGKQRKRPRTNSEGSAESVYCAQCGSRAKPGDRFCRTCGSRIRHEED